MTPVEETRAAALQAACIWSQGKQIPVELVVGIAAKYFWPYIKNGSVQ
jgi:hypothetical protein